MKLNLNKLICQNSNWNVKPHDRQALATNSQGIDFAPDLCFVWPLFALGSSRAAWHVTNSLMSPTSASFVIILVFFWARICFGYTASLPKRNVRACVRARASRRTLFSDLFVSMLILQFSKQDRNNWETWQGTSDACVNASVHTCSHL